MMIKKCLPLFLAMIIFLSLVGGENTNAQNGDSAENKLSITRVGKYADSFTDVLKPKSIYCDWRNNVWVCSVNRKSLLKIDPSGKIHEISGFENSVIVPGFRVGYCVRYNTEYDKYELYLLDPVYGPVFINDISLEANPNYNDYSILAINSKKVYYAAPDRLMNDNSIDIYFSNIGEDKHHSKNVKLGEKLYSVYGCAADESNLYVLAWMRSGRMIYRFDAATLVMKDKYKISFDNILNPVNLVRTIRGLYACDSDTICEFKLDESGKIVGVKSMNLQDKEWNVNVIMACPGRKGFVMNAGYKNAPVGIYEYIPAGYKIKPIQQPKVTDDMLYSVTSVASWKDTVYINRSKSVAIIDNDKVIQSYKTGDLYPSRMAVNSKGVLVCVGNFWKIGVLKDNTYNNVPVNGEYIPYGIDDEKSGSFVIRQRGGDGDVVLRFDPKNNSLTELFELPKPDIQSNDIAVIDENTLLLNWDNQLKLYDYTGKLIKEGPLYDNHKIADIEYSAEYDLIFVLDTTGDIMVVNPNTLEKLCSIDISEVQGQRMDLCVQGLDCLYVTTWNNGLYKVTGIGELLKSIN